MGCSNCSSSCGTGELPRGCKNNGLCSTNGCDKLHVFDWLAGMETPSGYEAFDCVEIRFKNSRKGYYRNDKDLPLKIGDAVAVEASPGHDIGVVSLTGELVKVQMNKRKILSGSPDILKVHRIASQADIDKWQEARSLEDDTMHRARVMALDLKLSMKISDVEYQGDKTKAVFYYTAEERVDFRELIKVMAEQFKVRIEMKQIGMRQEASRLGGIGSCGRELCCSTWLTDFRSVSTSAARYQQLALNPLKLAGQCGKLKCCLNYELDQYADALKEFPNTEKPLLTQNGKAKFQKMDIFSRTMWYSYEESPERFIELELDRVKEIIQQNAKGEKVAELRDFAVVAKAPSFENVVGQDDLTRFDKALKNKKKKRRKPKKGGKPQGQQAQGKQQPKKKHRSGGKRKNKKSADKK